MKKMTPRKLKKIAHPHPLCRAIARELEARYYEIADRPAKCVLAPRVGCTENSLNALFCGDRERMDMALTFRVCEALAGDVPLLAYFTDVVQAAAKQRMEGGNEQQGIRG